ncbi:MAG TPA: molybdopterin molybdotransferase MoeA [Thermoplasmata archaeon]|nr:molybdopterin molybdotransferase MoeA [Thermoplasmata archaeon]
MKMRPFGRLIPAAVAQRRLLRAVRPVTAGETIPLERALGRVAAAPVRSGANVPAFARATWDGYAVRSAETRGARPDAPVRLRVVGEVYAEGGFAGTLGPGEAAAIATGGAVPNGADSVVIFEVVRAERGSVWIRKPVRRGDRIAAAGADFARGASIVGRGDVLGPAALGALASVGLTTVRVYRPPRVAIIPNGNELVAPGRPLGTGQIYECNNLTLGSVARAAGAVVRTRPPVADDPRQIERAIRAALPTSDLVLVTGGSSVGERDFLPTIFPRIGRLLFHGVAVRPGKPTLAVEAGGKLVIGMPGHPTSCLSNGFWLLLPVLRRLARLPGPGWSTGSARLTEAYDPPTPGFATIIPLRVADGWGHPTFHDSSAITSLAGANAFAVVTDAPRRLTRGTRLPVHLLHPPLGAITPGDRTTRNKVPGG